ncbi:MAG: hypothetical protein IJQ22_08845 [Bacteroidales bacterium]|nr:hypothetical protein [Bacteroidales bacterium]
MNKRITISLLFLFYVFCLSAQVSSLLNVKAELDAMFAGLDKTKVPTGFLWDVAVNLVEADDYDGTVLTDSNYVSLPIMGDMLQSINSASVGADTICVHAALSRIQRNSSSQSPMVGILFQTYNYIVANALSDNLINYSAGVVSDAYVNGIWQNPYGEEVLFGSAIGNDGVVSQSATFVITNIDSLSMQTFQSIEFDPGDGNGFRPVSMGGTIVVSYPHEGRVEAKIKVLVGGQLYQSHSRLVVKNADSHNGITPDSMPLEITANYEGRTYKAAVTFSPGVFFNKRPLIVSEGFDPWRITQKKTTKHDYSGSTDLTNIPSGLISNYDVFYIDWYDYGADIRANAEVLKAVIRWVNSMNQSGQPNVVLGQSMGGLIARYALRDMELNNEPHNTTLFISHDVPYLGANVSPGLLYTYWDLRNIANDVKGIFSWFPKVSGIANELLRIGTYTSVKQMLPLYMDSEWHYDNTAYMQLQQEFNAMGFPKGDSANKQVENISIANGGYSSNGNPSLYNNGDTILHVFYELSTGVLSEMIMFIFSLDKGNLPLIPGKTTLSFQHDVYPYLANSALVRKTDFVFKKKLLWLLPISFNLFSKEHQAPSTGTAYDAYTGSYFDVAQLMGKDSIYHYTHSHSDSVWLGYFTRKITYAKKLSFIPTASAMVMPNDFGRDFLMNKPKARVDTPFDSFVLPDTSTFHTSFYTKATAFLNEVVETTISGPSIGVTGTEYSITGPNSSSFSFSTSSPEIATIDSLSNSLTVNNTGFVDVIAEDRTDNHVITKRKRILAGLPQMVLNHTSVPSGYEITASYVSAAVEDFLNSTGMKDSLQFKWQLNTGDNIQTVIDTSRVFTAVVDSLVSFASITFSVLYNGHESPKSSIILRNPSIYSYNVHSIRRFGIGTRYYSNLLESYSTCPSFKIWIETPFGYMVPNVYSGQFEKLKVLGKTIEGDYVQFNNIPCVEYDLFLDSDVAAFISSVTESDPIKTLYVYICDYEERVKQVVQIPIIWRAPL